MKQGDGCRLLFVDCYAGRPGRDKAAAYTGMLRRAAAGLGLRLVISRATDGALPAGAESFAAAVISGSHKMVGDGQFEPSLAGFLRDFRRPLLGICYGHQLLARAWGGTVVRGAHPRLGDEEIRLLEPHPLFAGFPERFPVNESHHEVVLRDDPLHQEFRLLAVDGGGQVEAIAHREHPLYGVQFHPERSGAWGEKLLANFLQLAPETG